MTAGLRRLVDGVLEAPVVTSFTRIGYDVRSRLGGWEPLDRFDLRGRTVLVTGATSGLGRSAAVTFARLGATLVLLGRDADRVQRVCAEIEASTGRPVDRVVADMGDLDAVRAAATEVLQRHPVLHVLVHNAGALTADRRVAPSGIEATVASQVVGPFLLTTLLLPALRAAAPGRVLTVSSGGMYTARLEVEHLQMGDDYRGAEQYARAKRAQVALNRTWSERIPSTEVVFHAMHPGWADTPGVAASLPTFRRVVGPLLRSPEQGVDTLVWLAAADAPGRSTGGFWLDRQRRGEHRVPGTRASDTPSRRAELWDWCAQASS